MRLFSRSLRCLALLITSALLVGAAFSPPRSSQAGQRAAPARWAAAGANAVGNNHLLITELFYNTHTSAVHDQYLRVENQTGIGWDISHWRLSDGKGAVRFPVDTMLLPGDSLYIARSILGFRQQFGFLPEFTYSAESLPGVRHMDFNGPLPRWGKTGGQVILTDADGKAVDAVYYGNANPGNGWQGAPVPLVGAGEVMHRARDQSTITGDSPGLYMQDTRTAADWKEGHEWVNLRVLRAGQSSLPYPSFQVEGNITAYSTPDTTFPTLADLLDSAVTSIDVNVYIAEAAGLADHLTEAAARGVKVRLLLDGQPFGGMAEQTRWFAHQVADAGGAVRFMRGDKNQHLYRRYQFDHAKYGIIDGQRSFVQSENWSPMGTAVDNSIGNRGWGVIVDDAALARYLDRVFELDWNPAAGDTVAYSDNDPTFGPPPDGFVPVIDPPTGSYPAPFSAQDFAGPHTVTPVFAPDNSLLADHAILGLLKQAQESVLVEQQYIYLGWSSRGDQETTPDLYLKEIMAAARRGVHVQVLLDSKYVGAPQQDPAPQQDNRLTCNYMNDTAAAEGLDLDCELIDLNATHVDAVHNKGLIVDGRYTLVSSINWSYNSPGHNRELGLIIDDPAIASYFTDIFAYDWSPPAE